MRVIPTDIPTLEISRFRPALRNRRAEERTSADDRSNRIGQELYSGCDHRHHQRKEALPRGHHRRSDRISPLAQKLNDQSARSRSRHKRFSFGLRAALRQAPKVILIGEMRDFETTEIALEAAETGHLVLSTLHTIDASKTVDRIIGLYPKNEEPVIRTRLAQTFRYIISQRLIPRADRRGRVAAVEILRSSPRTREYIEAGEADGKSLLDAMRDGKLDGMQDFDTVIRDFIERGVVSLEDGLAFATNQNNLLLELKGVTGEDYMNQREVKGVPLAPVSEPGSMLSMIE